MKLHRVHIKEFKSIWDSNSFETGQVTCLVGKNEAGKTGVLQALYRLNPIIDNEGEFDVTDDYPRSDVENYQQDIEAGRRQPAIITEATFTLDDDERKAVADLLGEDALKSAEIVVSKGYLRDEHGKCARHVSVPVDEASVVKHLVSSFGGATGTRGSDVREHASRRADRGLAAAAGQRPHRAAGLGRVELGATIVRCAISRGVGARVGCPRLNRSITPGILGVYAVST